MGCSVMGDSKTRFFAIRQVAARSVRWRKVTANLCLIQYEHWHWFGEENTAFVVVIFPRVNMQRLSPIQRELSVYVIHPEGAFGAPVLSRTNIFGAIFAHDLDCSWSRSWVQNLGFCLCYLDL